MTIIAGYNFENWMDEFIQDQICILNSHKHYLHYYKNANDVVRYESFVTDLCQAKIWLVDYNFCRYTVEHWTEKNYGIVYRFRAYDERASKTDPVVETEVVLHF
jgi:hypothetical protein